MCSPSMETCRIVAKPLETQCFEKIDGGGYDCVDRAWVQVTQVYPPPQPTSAADGGAVKLSEKIDAHITRRAEIEPAECAGCGAVCDPDGLCSECIERRKEYGAHRPTCRCDGCEWYVSTNQGLRARGLR